MADVATTLSALNGLTKQKYADKIKDAIPESNKLIRKIPFSERERIGKAYNQPVEMYLPQGMTYAPPGAGAFDLEDASPGQMENAQVDANQFLFVDCLDYESAHKARAKSEEAFESAAKKVMGRAMKAFTKRVELSFWYGGSSLALIGALATTTGPATDGLYERVVTVSTATWASGIWLGMKSAKVEARSTDSTTGYPTATKRNASLMYLGPVDVVGRKLTFRGAQADLNALVVGDSIVWAGTYGKETMGLDRVVTNKGVLWGIDATQYPDQWGGNVFDNGLKELSLRSIYQATGGAIAKGLEDTTLTAWLNPATFGNLLANEAALRRYYEATNGDAKNGFRNLTYQGQHGLIEFVPYINVKEGECFLGPADTLSKVGAQDITMVAPGRTEGEYWKPMEKKAGYEMRLYADLGLFCDSIGQWTKVTGIVNAL